MNKRIYNEKLIGYATAKRASAGQITNIVDGDFVTKWAGRLNGGFVKLGEEFKKDTRAEAVDVARRFRKSCIDSAISEGLIKPGKRMNYKQAMKEGK